MPAPKGNKNAVKGVSPKTQGYRWRLSPEALEALQKVAAVEKTSIAQVLEKAILKAYPGEFSDKF